ncbi:4-alpha-glucanotransferase [Atopobium minutum]|uniref:4-alpha-glucanotransferase n=1 Tax=Atopobium minutum 10063974 TaxID=997872 RepID=N2BV96_9ACTN|nr:4-alpha-glucanotransferase [Atopobium minutum]EMZ42528.1 4-alpha-glucanotransferase [Atopobium minutum 10063974]
MNALHNSRLEAYRFPYGAVPVDSVVRLSLDVWDENSPVTTEDKTSQISCDLRIWIDGKGETLIPMEASQQDDHLRFSCTPTFTQAQIVWYCFRLQNAEGHQWFYGASEGQVGGVGTLREWMGPSFQITAYTPRTTQPDWYRGGVAYQIFPDRFSRDKNWEQRAQQALRLHPHGVARHIQQDWNEPPYYIRDEKGRVQRWDFYGGSINGIREKLDYLQGMGITILYLNPIFEAASNHRYDTGNYLQIDPLLGDLQDFTLLCKEAQDRGISIILDGVFNHSGCDSLYFNKYNNYDSVGAYQSKDSVYRDWYKFDKKTGEYQSWWGVDDLPDIDEHSQTYRDYMFGKDGVVRSWLRAGARGWRLDVADELPDDFIKELRRAALAERSDALILGEVWEDASNKISYGKLRQYFLGDELDAVMNYNLREALLGYVRGDMSASVLRERMESMHENYPPDAFVEAFNLLGTHDTARILTLLGAPDPHNMDGQHGSYRLSESERGLAKGRLWLATLVQMLLPGVPCIYYGDEAGLEGTTDPFNRAAFPWGHEDTDCQAIIRNALTLRKTLPLSEADHFFTLDLGDEVFGFVRKNNQHNQSVAVLINRNPAVAHEVRVPLLGSCVDELIAGQKLVVDNGVVQLNLPPLGSAVLYFHADKSLGAVPVPGSGVLCHVSSLPEALDETGAVEGEQGCLGASARRFCDWLAQAHQTYWQVLPVNPTDEFGSPYAGISAFANNVKFISARERAQYERAGFSQKDYHEFVDKNASWLIPYSYFMALKYDQKGVLWRDWPENLRTYDQKTIADYLAQRPHLSQVAKTIRRDQFEFERQWNALHSYANERGIHIIGDIPLYISGDSADVWMHQDLFALDTLGNPALVAGVPSDAFSSEGQRWGNPVYNWDAMRATGYEWWLERLARSFELYDYVRLDHFIGFCSYYAIPQDLPIQAGHWCLGPGRELFQKAYERFGNLPVIAEDLGMVTPAVRALMASCGFYGMEVSLFSDYFSQDGWYVPAHKVAYTTTHDTQTLVGWCEDHFGKQDAGARAQEMLTLADGSNASLVIVQLQDVLGLDDTHRMNIPGSTQHNWQWVCSWDQLDASCATLRALTEKFGRA